MTKYPRDPLIVGARRRLPDFDYSTPDVLTFVTICAIPDSAPFTNPEIAHIVVDSLNWLRTDRGMKIYAYCLMPDHLHLLEQLAPESPALGDLIGAFKSFTTRQSWKHGWKGQLWQARFYDHLLRATEDAWSVAQYIRQNPVRKGLVQDPDAYPWSGYPDPLQ